MVQIEKKIYINYIIFSVGVFDGLLSKDGLFNDVIMWMEKRNLLFLNVDVEGKYFVQVKMYVQINI